MMDIQHYIRELENYLNTNGVESLWVSEGIKVKQYGGHPLYCLKYSSWSNKESPLVKSCRGTVVSLRDDVYRVESIPFIRFFNLGETEAPQDFNWNSYEAYEKYDGSLVTLFNYQGEWLLSTSSTIEGLINDYGVSDLFWNIWEDSGYPTNLDNLDPSQIYIWELCSKVNKVVVNYPEEMLVLLAVRSKFDLSELNLDCFKEKFKVAQRFKFSSKEELLEFVNSRKAGKSEGLVIKDSKGNRIKVKSREYVKFHNRLNNNKPNLGEIWALGELDEFLSYFPNYYDSAEEMISRIKEKSLMLEKFLNENQELSQKQFALKVLGDLPDFSMVLFHIRSEKSPNLESWLRLGKNYDFIKSKLMGDL